MANALTAYNPQLWANESVAILVENLVTARLVHTDFKNLIAEHGDIVNTRKPAEFTAKRKGLTDDVDTQDATAVNIQVPLNQHWHTSFLLRDGELSKSFKDLKTEYLSPAITSIAQAVDKVLLGQAYQFIANTEGKFGDFSSTTAKGYILDVRKRMNINKVPSPGRNLLLTPNLETETLKLDLFLSADTVGDEGTALREASLGRKLGFDIFMVQNASSIVGQVNAAGSATLIDLTAGYAKGDTVIHVDTAGELVPVGSWVKFVGDPTPHQVVLVENIASQDADWTLAPPLNDAILNDTLVTVGENTGEVVSEHLAGYDKEIVVDGITGTGVEVGQLVSFGSDIVNRYSVVEVTETGGNTTGITLDRPLVLTLANDDEVRTGLGGEYGFAFDRPALALISRPLALPEADLGARSAVAEFNGYGIRVVMSYDPVKQGVRITVDLLAGVKVLDADRGVLLVG
jgi:hypothetical protein